MKLEAPLAPTFTFPKLKLVGSTARRAVDTEPVPLNGMVSGDPGALLRMVIVPLALPADVGENFAVKLLLCPAVRVSGVAGALSAKPVPETLI